jgi:hypothetical protein
MRSKLLAFFAVVMAMLISPATASGAAVPQSSDQATVLRAAGSHAFAQFSSADPSGCSRTNLSLEAGDLVDQQPPGPPNRRSLLLFIFIFQYDDCTSTLLHNAEGFQELDENAFKVSDSPTPARLTTSLTVNDFTSGPFDVNVDLTWSVVDSRPGIRDTIHFELAPGCKVTAHVSSSAVFASVSGTVSAGGTNLTPEPGQGFVDYQDVGQVTIGGTACPPPEPL